MPDVRIVVMGTRERPRSSLAVNSNAFYICHPPGLYAQESTCWRPNIARHGSEVPPGRWRDGMVWVGPMMIIAELSWTRSAVGTGAGMLTGSQRYVSFTWEDLWVAAPWMREHIMRCIDGPGLGID